MNTNINSAEKSRIGKYINQVLPKIGTYQAFTPFTFPLEGGFTISPKLYKKHENAIRLIGKLDGISKLLPDKDFFLLMFIKKDATYSSQIEGTRATFQDAIAVDVTDDKSKLNPDVDDILHYIKAVNYSIDRVKELPPSLRLLKEIHKILMQGARSTHHAYPGEFRSSQNWIGARLLKDATFVPPAVSDMRKSLGDLENFIHADDTYLTLFKAGLIHAQFETIHPFADGNGRTGRMLIALYLHFTGILDLPVLYLSSFFNKYKQLYYDNLTKYHDNENGIEAWLDFFIDGVIEVAESSIDTCDKIIKVRERDLAKTQTLGVATASTTFKVVQELFKQPIVGIAEVAEWTGYTNPGAYKMIDRLIDLKILEPLGESKYGQKYVYADYYELFDEDFAEKR